MLGTKRTGAASSLCPRRIAQRGTACMLQLRTTTEHFSISSRLCAGEVVDSRTTGTSERCRWAGEM